MKLFKKKYNPEFDQLIKLYGKSVSVGRFTYGARNVFIHTWGEPETLKIGRYCSIAGNIQVYMGGSHRTDWISTFPFGTVYHDFLKSPRVPGHPKSNGDVVIGNDVWIGYGATIMSGINIGDGAVIGANAHVVSDVPPYAIISGNPAKVIRQRFPAEIINLLLEWKWWEFPHKEIDGLVNDLCAPPSVEKIEELMRVSRDWSRS
jgi:acetyltransferase-like isoleucine patch superfamily enzyme